MAPAKGGRYMYRLIIAFASLQVAATSVRCVSSSLRYLRSRDLAMAYPYLPQSGFAPPKLNHIIVSLGIET